MKRLLRVLMVLIMMASFGISNAQDTRWYGYARTCFNGENWQNKFITFTTQHPEEVQAVSETFPELWAATYLDGYVWFVTQTRSLCKAPFDEETQTIGAYETVVPALEQYNLYIDMAYNPVDEMMYYLCQDSQFNSYLKRSRLDSPSEVETVGGFDVRLWTLAINSQGQAYGVAYEGGNLYEIDLNNAATTLVGPTGKELWYTQSMAFDLETGELYWAQFATTSDHGLYQVNTETGAATSLGEIGFGTQLTGLFMVTQPTPPTGIAEQTTDNIALWPNPASSTLYLKVGVGETVRVFDMTGRKVIQQRYEGKLNVSQLNPGIYALKAEGRTMRFVKE